jgi:NAD(P)-dependent dehydrogenase (short-subunit alcohol dehydrogenase family)
LRLNGRVALITGGNSGIGLATAKLFIDEGAKVAITGRNQKTLDAAALELGPDVLVIRADVSDLATTEEVIAATVARFGKLDVVFANAGIGTRTPVGTTSVESFEEVFRVNVTSAFFLVQAALPYLSEGASVIFNGSVQSTNGRPGGSAYAASKAALRSMARVLASELSPRGIRVNIVTPGSADTPIWNLLASTPEDRSALFDQVKRSIPLGRIAKAKEIANVVLFLASSESSFVQATEIVVDGGATGAPLGAPIYRDALRWSADSVEDAEEVVLKI